MSTARRSFLASTTAHGLIIGAFVASPFVLMEPHVPTADAAELLINFPHELSQVQPDLEVEPNWEVTGTETVELPELEPYPIDPSIEPQPQAESFDDLPLDELAFFNRPMFLRPYREQEDEVPLEQSSTVSATVPDAPDPVEAAAPSPVVIRPAKLEQHCPKPIYPEHMARRGWQGTVHCRLFVDANGKVSQVKILESSGYERLDSLAQEALERWRFTPATRDGVAVAMTLDELICFQP